MTLAPKLRCCLLLALACSAANVPAGGGLSAQGDGSVAAAGGAGGGAGGAAATGAITCDGLLVCLCGSTQRKPDDSPDCRRAHDFVDNDRSLLGPAQADGACDSLVRNSPGGVVL